MLRALVHLSAQATAPILQAVVWVDPDEMRVECCVMDLGHGESVWNYGMAEPLILVRHNVRRVEQQRLRYARDRTTAIVGGDDGLAKRCLMQPLLYCSQGIASLKRGRWWHQ